MSNESVAAGGAVFIAGALERVRPRPECVRLRPERVGPRPERVAVGD